MYAVEAGSSAVHTHTCGIKATVPTSKPTVNQTGATPLNTNSYSRESEYGGRHTVSINTIQPYIVVNIWKRTS